MMHSYIWYHFLLCVPVNRFRDWHYTHELNLIRQGCYNLKALQEITRIVEAQLGKITESQTLILAKFAGKAEPNPVEDLKMIRIQREEPEDYEIKPHYLSLVQQNKFGGSAVEDAGM